MADTLAVPAAEFGYDFVGASQVAFEALLGADWVDPAAFLAHLREYVRATPVTHNQRQLVTAVLGRCLADVKYDDPPEAPADGR
jgi:hypothetical protein